MGQHLPKSWLPHLATTWASWAALLCTVFIRHNSPGYGHSWQLLVLLPPKIYFIPHFFHPNSIWNGYPTFVSMKKIGKTHLTLRKRSKDICFDLISSMSLNKWSETSAFNIKILVAA
jgi:hypothetical protein